MPTQMPRNGVPRLPHGLAERLARPATACRPRAQSAKAPTPGSTIRVGRRSVVGIGGHLDRRVGAGLASGRSKALRAECRLPDP